MAFNNSFTAVTGATYTAAQYNTHVRDNLTAIWVYTTAGDIAYATSATALVRLGIGASNTVLGSSGSAPQWTHTPPIAGVLHTKNTVYFAPGGQQFTGSTWGDITGATFNLTLTVTCTIMVWAVVTGYQQDSGRAFYVRANVNGVADPESSFPYNGTQVRNESLPYIYYATGITAGTRTVKLQTQGDGGSNGVFVERGRLIALAFAE